MALLAGACDAGDPPAATPSVTASKDGTEADAILKQAFTGMEELGSGYGVLQPIVGNHLASTPEDTLSVTFALVCTGGASAHVSVQLEEAEVASVSGDSPCDGSIFQRSISLAKPSLVGFSADITGPTDGSFAYAYFTEKRRS